VSRALTSVVRAACNCDQGPDHLFPRQSHPVSLSARRLTTRIFDTPNFLHPWASRYAPNHNVEYC
jgi:hypothetical protein